jgi:hypothetical protein
MIAALKREKQKVEELNIKVGILKKEFQTKI